jgi:HlyD family secretion protein
MTSRARIVIGVAALALMGGAGWYWFHLRQAPADKPLTLYGNVEVREVALSFRQGGRIAKMLVNEGDRVEIGQELADLDVAPFLDALASSDADIRVARAEVARLRTPSRSQDIAKAAASVRQFEGSLQQAGGTFAQAEVAVRQSQITVRQLEANLAQTEAMLRNAQTDFQRQNSLVPSGAVSLRTRDIALAARDSVRAQRDAALAARDVARTQAQGAQAAREAAFGAMAAASAAVDAQRQTLSLTQEGTRPVDVLAGEARVGSAQAGRQRNETALSDTKLLAPSPGVVLTRATEPGAMTQAGSTVYTLSLGDPVYVRAYVPATQLGKAVSGTVVSLKSDASARTYAGRIGFIAPRAEFTPKNVETEDLRTDLVYRVRIIVSNADAALLPGMPVTISIGSTPK